MSALAKKISNQNEQAIKIKKVAVLGSGVMGAAIAANVASSGTPVLLLDIVPAGATDRNALTKSAVEKMLNQDPSPFTHPDKAKLVTCGNLEDNLDMLVDCDWIIEAVLEKIEVKHDVYAKVEKYKKKGAIVSSNTSTIPLAKLIEGRGDDFSENFVIAHFFNPPRYLKLLELVTGDRTNPAARDAVKHFCDVYLGKGVVPCKDTPGFIGNRIGCFWLQAGLNEAIKMGITVEEADAVMGKPVGIPRTAVFGLYDLIGIDLMLYIGKSLTSLLPKTDEYSKIYQEPELIKKMVADGYTGRKGKGGFFRVVKTPEGKKSIEALDLKTGEYRPEQKAKFESVDSSKGNLLSLVSHNDNGGKYAWAVLSQTICYAASLVSEISDSIADIDAAMKTGYGWKMGPFEMLDKIGAKWFADKLKSEGRAVPEIISKVGEGKFYKTENNVRKFFAIHGKYVDDVPESGAYSLADIKLATKPLYESPSANLWDIGDGIACLEFTTKMNAVDDGVLTAIEKSIEIVSKEFKGLVIANDADNFSVGANLNFFLTNAKEGNWKPIEDVIKRGQNTFMALKYSDFPVVSGLAGMALGGGCEVVLHSNAVNAHIESYAGLVEIGVGLIPGWGGCKESVLRFTSAFGETGDAIRRAFEQIAGARVSKSADDLKDMLYLSSDSKTSMNRSRIINDAKMLCLELQKNYKPKKEAKISISGSQILKMLETIADGISNAGKASPHDLVVMKHLAQVLSNEGKDGDVTERELLALECKYFMQIIKTEGSIARIEHMLNTGKPLKN